jgi:hypothetical protein
MLGAVAVPMLLGGWLGHVGPVAPAVTTTMSATPGGQPQGPPGAPAGPPPGAVTDDPRLEVSQPGGDRITTFTVHGEGWHPGGVVRLRLGDKAVPNTVIPDRAGSFNYTLNQGGELYPNGLPLGKHVVTATGKGYIGGQATARATFSVGGQGPG